MNFPKQVKFNKKGLVPTIIQEASSGKVLMLAYMNREALRKTLRTQKTHFYSRSRQKLWLKGESSGHLQTVRSVHYDCDWDTLLIKVFQKGGACHEGYHSCFFRKGKGARVQLTGKKVFDPKKVYRG